jgi:hypothetical protein
MKKLVLGLFATIMFGFAGNAQTNAYTKSAMVVIVTQAKSTFVKGESYKDWLLHQTGNSTIPTPQEEKLLKDVYGFLSTSSNSDVVYKGYDGVSLTEVAKLQQKGGLTVLGSSNAKCGFWCQLIIAVIQILIDALPTMP